jgi:hypothetical protein
MLKKILPIFAVVLGVAGSAMATVSVDLTSTAGQITTDLAAGQTQALPIFAIMFGVPLVLAFFRRIAH